MKQTPLKRNDTKAEQTKASELTRPDRRSLWRTGPAALVVLLAGLVGCTRHADLIVDGSLSLGSTELTRGQDTLVVRFEMADAALVRFEVWNMGGYEKWHSADTNLAAGTHLTNRGR